jgi:hypothetical protein
VLTDFTVPTDASEAKAGRVIEIDPGWACSAAMKRISVAVVSLPGVRFAARPIGERSRR